MSVLLLNAPWTHPFHPGLNTPALKAYLEREGIACTQRDCSIEAFRYLIAPDFLTRCMDRLSGNPDMADRDRDSLLQVMAGGAVAVAKVEEAIATIRDPARFFDLDQLLAAQGVLRSAFATVSAAHPPLVWKDIYWELEGCYQNSALIAQAVDAEHLNPFAAYFREFLVPSLRGTSFDVIGISVSLDQMSQLVPALTLARILREAFPETHICAGGVVFSKLDTKIDSFRPFFRHLDSVVLYEGETALTRLAGAIAAGDHAAIPRIPNLLTLQNGVLTMTTERTVEDVNALPVPDFDGLPLDSYLSPHLILPFAMSRGGCYFAKCTFCDTNAGHIGGNRRRDTTAVAADMQAMSKATGARHFICVDEAIEIDRLQAFSTDLIAADAGFKWSCWSRAIPKMTRETLDLMGRAGCSMITYGVDSGSDRILRDMRKATRSDLMARIMEDTERAGIAASVNVILGYPSETQEDREQTVDFLFRINAHVVKANLLPFFFKANTPVNEERDRYPVVVHPANGEDLAVFFSHHYESGATQAQVNALCEELEAALRRQNPAQDLVSAISQHPNAFLFFSEIGLEGGRALAESHFGPAPAQPQGWTGLDRPRMPANLHIAWPSGSAAGIFPAERSNPCLLVNTESGNYVAIPGHIGRILSLCDGRQSIDEISSRIDAELLLGPAAPILVSRTLAQMATTLKRAAP